MGLLTPLLHVENSGFNVTAGLFQLPQLLIIAGLVVQNSDNKFPIDEFSTAGSILEDPFGLIQINIDGLLDFGGVGIGEDAAFGLTFADRIFFFAVPPIFLFVALFFFFLQLENFTISQVIIIHNSAHELIHVALRITIIYFFLAIH